MGEQRVDVVLDEPAAGRPGRAGADAGQDRVRARRAGLLRALRRWWPVPVLAVAGLVATHAVGEARAEAAAERLRGVDGVLGATVRPGLTARAWPPRSRAEMLVAEGTRTTGGLLALPWIQEGGAWDVVAVDAATGGEAWRTRLVGPAPEGEFRDVRCVPDAAPAAAALGCTVLTGPLDWREWRGTLLRVDLADGRVADVGDLPAGASAVLVGDAVVTARPQGEGVAVTSAPLGDPAAVTWRADLPGLVVPDGDPRPWLEVAGGHVWVGGDTVTWSVAAATGAVEGSGAHLVLARGDRVVDAPGSTGTRVLATDGAVRTEGTPETAYPDDGSVPDLILLRRYDGSSPDGFLRAVDAATGATVWERPLALQAGTNLVVLDGLVHGATRDAVWAVDLATGEDRWTTPGDPGVGAALMSDGRALLRTERDPDDGTPLLAAYGLDDGRRLWAAPLPEGVSTVRADGAVLRGSGPDSTWVLD
ncbi:PQQ-binding-like beta-propeller repeat protein [Cellulomonas sp.]|uniref:outer membrane protein assembly factor BamB family protein n=1 Tax=Cellulomonas sp. TaxID=40001 RepID=UPI002D3A273E|nr:PQQ-binding-like beta-propeller repeat protein [Cellulomonas sp.]HYQ75072.1 PQQ-binding-like beta-propeller repeat protein [Cellulomonas sp.]